MPEYSALCRQRPRHAPASDFEKLVQTRFDALYPVLCRADSQTNARILAQIWAFAQARIMARGRDIAVPPHAEQPRKWLGEQRRQSGIGK